MQVDLLTNYYAFISKLDDKLAELLQKAGSSMVCRKKCSSCCRHIEVFTVEAFALGMAFLKLDKKVQERTLDRIKNQDLREDCPLLEDGLCLLYEARPLICRTHGFPLLIKRDEQLFLDFCPLNFKDNEELALSSALDLEILNTILSSLQILFLKEGLLKKKPDERMSIAKALLLFSDFSLI